MKLQYITESENQTIENLHEILIKKYGSTDVVNKLIDFATSNHKHPNPQGGTPDTISKLRNELITGMRLVGNPWKEDIDQPTDGLYVVDYGKQLMISLPLNSDVADFVASQKGGSISVHVVRGLAFGYNPQDVYDYAMRGKLDVPWRSYLKELGITLSSDVNNGYASSASETSWLAKTRKVPIGSVTIEPNEVSHVNRLLPKLGNLLAITRYCPICNNYILVSGTTAPGNPHLKSCPHPPIDEPEKMGNQRAFFSYEFDITPIMHLLS